LAAGSSPIFTLFYLQGGNETVTPDQLTMTASPSVSLLPEAADAATESAEALFRQVVNRLRNTEDGGEDVPFWPPLDSESEDLGQSEEDW